MVVSVDENNRKIVLEFPEATWTMTIDQARRLVAGLIMAVEHFEPPKAANEDLNSRKRTSETKH